MYLILCLHCGGKQLVKLLARKLIIVTDDMFGLIKSHFPNARIEFIHCPLFSLVLFCRPTHHEKTRKKDGAHLSSLGNLSSFSPGEDGGLESLVVYGHSTYSS